VLCLFNAIEALSQMSYSPTRLDEYSKRVNGPQERDTQKRGMFSFSTASGA
jgi:hypothetical protein